MQRAHGLATYGLLSVGLVSFGLEACGGVMTDSGSDDGSSGDLRDSDDSGDGVGTGGSTGVG
ncbi:MAG TPA: hypothetical protein VLC09_14325, partial [Polyangiaceae bacterium]|nr:hypothetical protein [Polyangiaceae bacterium]